MKEIFADALYWIALINPRDQWHQTAKDISNSLNPIKIITSENALEEVLNFYCGMGMHFRKIATQNIRAILDNSHVEVVPASHESFTRGVDLYESRPDKGYSLTDCISMNLMRDRKLDSVLTRDNHFAQEGFTVLS